MLISEDISDSYLAVHEVDCAVDVVREGLMRFDFTDSIFLDEFDLRGPVEGDHTICADWIERQEFDSVGGI